MPDQWNNLNIQLRDSSRRRLRRTQIDHVMKIKPAIIISGDDQQVAGAVHSLLGGGSVVDMRIGSELNERRTQTRWELLGGIVQTGRLVVNRAGSLGTIFDRCEDINHAVLIIEQYDRTGVIVTDRGKYARAPGIGSVGGQEHD